MPKQQFLEAAVRLWATESTEDLKDFKDHLQQVVNKDPQNRRAEHLWIQEIEAELESRQSA